MTIIRDSIRPNHRIKELESLLRTCEKSLKEAQKLFESTPDPTKTRGISSKKSTIDLFDAEDVSEIDGILVWDGEDPLREDQTSNELDG